MFVHAFPPLVAWAQRWYPPDAHHWKGSVAADAACSTQAASMRELILIPWLPYFLWAIGYYIKIFVVSSRKIQDRGYHTLFRYLTRKPNSPFSKSLRTLPRWLAPVLFMFWHILFCAISFLAAWGMWQSYILNTTFLVLMLFVSTWNGGNYYFEVFAVKYAQAPERRYSEEVAPSAKPAGEKVFVRASSDSALHTSGEEEWPASEAAVQHSDCNASAPFDKEQ